VGRELFDIEVRKFKDMDLKGATVVDGFPCLGLASTISATYLVSNFNLDQIAALDSEYFPPISMVYACKPKFPARIYAISSPKLAVFISEFSPYPFLNRSLGKTLFNWAKDHQCSLIVTSVGLPIEGEDRGEMTLLAVGSTENARSRIDKAGLNQLEIGMIAGIPGTLLNEGRWSNFDVIALLVKAHPQIPDPRAASEVVVALGRLVPELRVDVKPLLREAERIEARLKDLREQVKPVEQPVPKAIYG